MIKKAPERDAVVHFWDWYERRCARQRSPIANLALDKCEEALAKRKWTEFAYWHSIYLRERPLPHTH